MLEEVCLKYDLVNDGGIPLDWVFRVWSLNTDAQEFNMEIVGTWWYGDYVRVMCYVYRSGGRDCAASQQVCGINIKLLFCFLGLMCFVDIRGIIISCCTCCSQFSGLTVRWLLHLAWNCTAMCRYSRVCWAICSFEWGYSMCDCLRNVLLGTGVCCSIYSFGVPWNW
jgi:hypothetical protein